MAHPRRRFFKTCFIFFISLVPRQILAQAGVSGVDRTFPIDKKARISISVKWDRSPENGEDVMKSILSFYGKFKKRTYRWVQIARVQLENESDFIFRGFQEDRNYVRSDDGFFLDQNYDLCRHNIKKCSLFYRDHFENSEYSSEIDNLAQMADFPYGWTQFKRISLQSCLYNTKTNKIEHCVDWGGEWAASKEKLILQPRYHQKPTLEFLQALSRFKNFYRLNEKAEYF